MMKIYPNLSNELKNCHVEGKELSENCMEAACNLSDNVIIYSGEVLKHLSVLALE